MRHHLDPDTLPCFRPGKLLPPPVKPAFGLGRICQEEATDDLLDELDEPHKGEDLLRTADGILTGVLITACFWLLLGLVLTLVWVM